MSTKTLQLAAHKHTTEDIDGYISPTWEALPDKPFGTYKLFEDIVVDENYDAKNADQITGIENITGSDTRCLKISNQLLTKEQLECANVYLYDSSTGDAILHDNNIDIYEQYGCVIATCYKTIYNEVHDIIEDEYRIIIGSVPISGDFTDTLGINIPSSGIYFQEIAQLRRFNKFVITSPEFTKPIDEKYIPESIARKEDIPNGGSAGVTSWNDLEDKPFYSDKEFDDIFVDYNNESFYASDKIDLTPLGESLMAYKVTDHTITIEQLKNSKILLTYDNGTSLDVTEINDVLITDVMSIWIANVVVDYDDGGYNVVESRGSVVVISCSAVGGDLNIPSVGTYISENIDTKCVVDTTTIVAPGYTKTIDESFLPESVKSKVRANLEQNDPFAPDYVIGRTHYEYYEKGMITSGNGVYTTIETDGIFTATIPYSSNASTMVPENGYDTSMLTVMFDEKTYKDLSVTETDMGRGVGNPSIINSVLGVDYADTGEPFLIVVTNDNLLLIVDPTQSSTHEVYVYVKRKMVKQLDPKFYNTGPGKVGSVPTAEIFNDYENNKAMGKYSHAEGKNVTAFGDYSHAEGRADNQALDHIELTSETTLAEIQEKQMHDSVYFLLAFGDNSHAEGYATIASGRSSHAEGDLTIASGRSSHAEGDLTKASGYSSHAEGCDTKASGYSSHAEGCDTTASGQFSHAEGYSTKASGNDSHAEGSYTKATGNHSHAEGEHTIASGNDQHVQGRYSIEDTENQYAHIVGNGNSDASVPYYSNAHTLDWQGNAWFAGNVYVGSTSGKNMDEGSSKLATVKYVDEKSSKAIIDVVELPTEGIDENCFYRLLTGNLVFNQYIHNIYNCYCVETLPETGLPATNLDQSEGNVYYNISDGKLYGYVDDTLSAGLSVPTGWYTASVLLGALGYEYAGVINDISDDPEDDKFRFLLKYVVYSHKDAVWTSTEVIGTRGTGPSAEVFNHPTNVASGDCSHAEGLETYASGDYSHAEGYSTKASGEVSHAEGLETYASGDYSHAEGYDTKASGSYSHAEGYSTTANGYYSHAEGCNTIAAGDSQHVQGRDNIFDTEGKYAHIVGNGTSENNRSNAHTLDWEGNAWFAGDVLIGGESQDDDNAVSLKALSEEIKNGKVVNVDNETLIFEDGKLKVNTVNNAEADNTHPISSAAVHALIGDIEALLKTI